MPGIVVRNLTNRRSRDVETVGRKGNKPVGAALSLDDFYRRRAEGKGRTFTRDEIENLGSVRAVLATVLGIRVETDVIGNFTGITAPRCSPSVATTQSNVGMDRSESSSAGGTKLLWFVDGQQVQTTPDFDKPSVAQTDRGVQVARDAPRGVGMTQHGRDLQALSPSVLRIDPRASSGSETRGRLLLCGRFHNLPEAPEGAEPHQHVRSNHRDPAADRHLHPDCGCSLLSSARKVHRPASPRQP